MAAALRGGYASGAEAAGGSRPWLRAGLGGRLAGDLVGALEEGVVDVLGTRDLGLDHAQVLGVGQALGLHRVRLGGCGHQCGRVLGTVEALGEALVGQALVGGAEPSAQGRGVVPTACHPLPLLLPPTTEESSWLCLCP